MSKNRIAVTLTGDASNLVQAFHTGRLAATSFGSSMNESLSLAQRASSDYDRSTKQLGASLTSLTGLLKGAAAGFSAMQLINMADDWGQYASRMKMATESTAEYEHAQSRMAKSAQTTFRSINETREAFINLSPVLRDMGMTLDQSIDAVDAFSGLLVVAGANSQRGASAMSALEKSFQRGKVSAQDWMTIYSTADGILEHLVSTTGKTANELRRLGVEGKLSANEIAVALTAAYEPVMKQVEKMPTTVGDALTNFHTSFSEFIGELNKGTGATSVLVTGINLLSSNLERLAYVGGAVALVIGSRFVAAQLQGVKATITNTSSLLANRLALMSLSAQIAGTSRAAVVGYGAMATAARGASAAIALVGGPAGLAMLGLSAAAMYALSTQSAQATTQFDLMALSVDELRKKTEELTATQLKGLQASYLTEYEKAIKSADKSFKDLLGSVSGLNLLRFDVTNKELMGYIDKLKNARESGEDLAPILDELRLKAGVPFESVKKWYEHNVAMFNNTKTANELKEKVDLLEGKFGAVGSTALSAASAISEMSEADFTKLITGLEGTLSVIGMTNQQAAEYKARLEGASNEQARLAGVLAGMADAARKMEKATQDKDAKAVKGAQEVLNKLIEQEVQIRINLARQAEYAALLAMGIEGTIAAQGADTAAILSGFKFQEEITARIKMITENIGKNTEPSLKKAASGAKKLSGEIDSLVGSLFPALKAQDEWVKGQKLLAEALKKGKVTQEQYNEGIKKLRENYEKIAFEAPEHVKALQDEGKSLKDSLPGLRDRVRHFGLSATAIAKLAESETKASLVTAKSTLAKEQSTGASEKRIKQIEQEIKALEELAKHQSEAVGHTEKYERLELEKKANDEALDEWQKTVDKYGDVFRDGFAVMLNDGRSDWKSWGQSLVTTFKTTVADQLYKLFAEPFVARIALSLSGLGASRIAAATSQNNTAQGMSLLSGLKGTSSLASVFSSSVVSGLSSGIGSVGNLLGSHALQSFSAGMAGTLSGVTGTLSGASAAASLGTTVGTGAIANPAFAAAVNGGSLTGAAGMGAQFAAVAPWLAGGAAVLGLGLMAHNMMKGETRHGAYMQYDLAARQAVAKGGPSGGYGGQATIDAATQLFSSTVDTINSVLEGVGAKAQTAWFHGMFESSDKGRGGTFAGGSIQLADGSIVDFGTSKKGDGFGGKSGTAEEMFANLQSEVHFAALEAWKAVGTEMPQVIRDMLAGVDVRSLTAEQAQGLVAEISNTVGAVNALSDAFNQMPLENLKNLSFDVAHGLGMASGGLDALSANVASFYQGFYSEAERQEHLHRQLVDTLGAVNMQLPSSREGFRRLVDSLGEVTEANQATIAALLGAASAADQYYAELERRQNEAHQERQRLEQEAYNSARSHVDKLMSAFKELAQKQIRELEQVSKSTDKVANALQKSLNTQISSLTSVSSMLTDMVNELRGGAKLFEMQSAEGWRVIGNTISTGVLPDADKLRSAVGSIRSDLDDRYYGSIFERQRDQLVLANQLDSINALAKPQLTIAEQQLQVMQDQLAELREGTKRAFELAGLSQAQIAAIKSVDDKTAANVGLTKEQLEALRTGNNASAVLQNLTREQIQGILGVKSEVVNVHGLTAQQLAELSRNTGVTNVIKSLTDAQIAALKAVDAKTAKALGLSESQITALQSGNAQALALQGLTREQIQGILGVKSETSSLHGLSQSQIDAMRAVDLSTQSVAELIDHLQKATEAERLASKQIETIQSQLGTMQAQYEQLRDLNTSMGSLDEGMRLLAVAMKAEQVAKPEPSNSKAFGGRDFEFKNQTAAKNYLLGNAGLLGSFAEEVAKGWASPTDYLKFAQLHYSSYGWAENRTDKPGENKGRTHKPEVTSEAQAYLAANQDVMTAYLREVKSGGAAGGDRGMLAFVQSHFDQYGRHEMPLRKYARGGDHMGGLRLVGELGPELEVTGPSRIFNANKTQDILRNMSAGPDISGLMQSLLRENQQLRQMYENMMRSMIAMQQRMARVLERWEGDDYPVRVEEMPAEPVIVKIKKEVA